MKILFILDYYSPHLGGLETVFFNIVEKLLAQNHTIDIITCKHESSLPTLEKHNNLTIHRVGSTRKNFIMHAFTYGYQLLKTHKNNQFDMIHTTTYAGAIPSSVLAQLFTIPVILTVHEIFGKLRYRYKSGFSAWIHAMFEKTLFSLPYDHYHCVSYYTFNSLRLVYGLSDDKLSVIHNGVDTSWSTASINPLLQQELRQELSMNVHKKYILYYGHSGISKGLDYLIDALPSLASKSPDTHFIINLIPAQRDSLIKNKIEAMKLTNITLLNGLPEEKLKNLVALVDAVIAPSLSEGFGSVHTETVQIGTPLITTPVGPLPEVLGGNVTRIQPGSSEAIVQGVLDFQNKKNNQLLAAKSFSRDITVEKIEELYFKLRSPKAI